MVLVSHSTQVIETFCSRAVLLEEGRVAFVGSGREVAAQYMQRLAPPKVG
jgi:ABC-type polysaccharide/polyol phosphate transport system ATPase subunit